MRKTKLGTEIFQNKSQHQSWNAVMVAHHGKCSGVPWRPRLTSGQRQYHLRPDGSRIKSRHDATRQNSEQTRRPMHFSLHIYFSAYMPICIHIHEFRTTYTRTYIHTYLHTYMHTYVHTYMHTYLCAHIQTYTHIDMFLHLCLHILMHPSIYPSVCPTVHACRCVFLSIILPICASTRKVHT